MVTIQAPTRCRYGEGAVHHPDYAEQVRRLKRFISPQVARFILSCNEGDLLQCQRREITVAFGDLRGFTSFAEAVPPEHLMAVVRMYHEVLGELIVEFDGTLERFTGDGIMVYFDEPPVEEQAERALAMAIRMRARVGDLCARWRRRGHQLDFGMGIAQGPASVGAVGFQGRYDYAAIGPVTNLSSRLCGHAGPGQILISQPVYRAIQRMVDAERVDGLALDGFPSEMTAYSVRDLKSVTGGNA
jgi:adenylate cyclase